MNVMVEICTWANSLKYWEQAALERILAGQQFTEDTYEELLTYMLQDSGLAEPTVERPLLKRLEHLVQNGDSPRPGVRLVKMGNLQNVNALVPGQDLPFGPALTAIYGQNGSGKSGYARVLGCVGFTRGDKEVLPDVTQPMCPNAPCCVDLTLSDGRCITHEIGGKCADLASYYVFDSTSVRVHLNEENRLSFSPGGLSCLGRLADETDKVRDLLKARIRQCQESHAFEALFPGESEVRQVITELGPDTHSEELRSLGKVSQQEQRRLATLDREIAELKADKMSERIRDLSEAIGDLKTLKAKLIQISKTLGDEALSEVNEVLSTGV